MPGKEIHVLVAEDDKDINQLLCSVLHRTGYKAKPVYSGTEALLYWDHHDFDMVLLDLMLPGMSGEELIPHMREKRTVPIIVISAKGASDSKVSALRTGADDYITKPFDIEEVSARIDLHIRRYRQLAESPRSSVLTHKDLSLDTESSLVTVQGNEVMVTAKEFAILALLLSHPKKIFSKTNLFESVWGEDYLGDDNTISVHMRNLRSKLNKANSNEDYIETIWGMGYRLK